MPDDALLGAQIAGYRIEAQIGRGGMGRVYRAIQLGLNRPVALKILSSELAHDETFRARFLKEAQLAATLEHPSILPIYEVGEDAGLLFMSMRLVEGTDLASLLRREGALTPARTLALLAQAADALDFAHAAGLVHRDVKPANLLLARDLLYLADFGIAKAAAARRELTRTGIFIGTIDYASPEQIRNEPLSGSTDIYAMGCVLYQCLTGDVPFDRPSEFGVMQAHLQDPPPKPSEHGLPEVLDAVIAAAMAKAPDERFRSGRRLVDAARAALEGRDAPSPAPPTVTAPITAVPPTVIHRAPLTGAEAVRTEDTRRRGGSFHWEARESVAWAMAVHSHPHESSTRVARLTPSADFAILGREGNCALIRTVDGRTGYIPISAMATSSVTGTLFAAGTDLSIR